MTERRRIVVTAKHFDDRSLTYLQDRGFEVAVLPGAAGETTLSSSELQALLADAQGWIVGHAYVTQPLLEALPQLKIVARRGVGYERVDVAAVRALGRVAVIAAGGNDASVADHVIGLMIATARRFHAAQQAMLADDWTIPIGGDLYRKVVGVVGLGRIGRSVVQRLAGFEAEVLVSAPRLDDAFVRHAGVTPASLPELLGRSDFVTLHAPLTSETRLLIDAAALGRMKPGAILINTARGGLVDDAALLAALESGRLGGAGLDVFMSETDADYKPVTQALLASPRVVATPHSAASSAETLARTNRIAAEAVVAVLEGRSPPQEMIVADGRRRAD